MDLLAAALAAVNPAGWPVHAVAEPDAAPPPGPAFVVIRDANDAAFDRIKRRLVEVAVIGGAHPVWIGATAAPPLPPDRTDALVVSFFTRATRYEAHAARLRESLERQGVDHLLVGLDVPGTWEMVCAFKAEFVREQWQRAGRPVVWLDADATLVAPLGLLAAPGADFAIVKHTGWKFASGTILFGRGAAAGALLDRWVLRCRADPMMWDQNHLDAAWADVSAELPLVTRWLPPAYVAIHDHYDAAALGPAVVMQHQASRASRKAAPPPKPEALRTARRVSRWQRGAASLFHGVPPRGALPEGLAQRIRALAGNGLPLVDVGCGEGALARGFAPGAYLGADVRPEAILAARSAMPGHAWRLLMEEYPFPTGGTLLLLDVLGPAAEAARAEILARAATAAPRLILCDRPGLPVPPGWQVSHREAAEGGREVLLLAR